MVKKLIGLKKGPRVPPIFGGDSRPCGPPIRRCDEIRCSKGDREIYVGILGVAADGMLLGQVLAFGELRGFNPFGVELGDLVSVRADRVLALLLGNPPELSEDAATPILAMAHG